MTNGIKSAAMFVCLLFCVVPSHANVCASCSSYQASYQSQREGMFADQARLVVHGWILAYKEFELKRKFIETGRSLYTEAEYNEYLTEISRSQRELQNLIENAQRYFPDTLPSEMTTFFEQHGARRH